MKKTGLEKEFKFDCDTPCKSCPYRKDAVLRLWAKEEFERLLESDSDYFGVTYGCHKKNGSICVGWLMLCEDEEFEHNWTIMWKELPSQNRRIVKSEVFYTMVCSQFTYEGQARVIEYALNKYKKEATEAISFSSQILDDVKKAQDEGQN
jgi:hypothetical protein